MAKLPAIRSEIPALDRMLAAWAAILNPVLALPVLGFDPEAVEAWRVVGAAAQPGFSNGWAQYDVTRAAAFRRHLGTVRLRGLAKSGTVGQTIFILPAGYRPATLLTLAVVSNAALGILNIDTDGRVTLTAGSNAYVSFDGISFPAEG